MFLPLISANTEARDEGFFHEEWALASARSRRTQGTARRRPRAWSVAPVSFSSVRTA